MTDRNDAQRQAVVVPRQDGHGAGEAAFITGATSGIETGRLIEQAGARSLRRACDRTIRARHPGRPADPRGRQ
jgi:hypothetical protein